MLGVRSKTRGCRFDSCRAFLWNMKPRGELHRCEAFFIRVTGEALPDEIRLVIDGVTSHAGDLYLTEGTQRWRAEPGEASQTQA